MVAAASFSHAAASEQRADLLGRELLYYLYAGEGYKAISRYRAGVASGDIKEQDSLAARLHASWGLFDDATRLYGSAAVQTPRQRAGNWFSLGKAYYERQRYAEAVSAFEKVGLYPLPRELEYQRLLLMGLALYQLDNFAASSSALWSIHSTSKQYPFARINIGMGSIKIGSWPGGISGLGSIRKRIGIDVKAPPQFADRLNTVFGYLLLYEEYSGSKTAYGKASMHGFTTPSKRGYKDAREMLEAVSDEGLYANKAMLGRAWIAIDTNELAQARIILERLNGKDPRHLTVQEAKLALAYVLERMGDVGQAINYYRNAAGFFENERNRLDGLLQRLGRGELDNAFLTLKKDAAAQNQLSGYLPEMLLAPLWDRLLGDFEDIARLRLRLDEWRKQLVNAPSTGGGISKATVLSELSRQQAALDGLHLQTARLLRRQAGEQLAERRRRVNHYLNQARYGLAELYGRQQVGGVDAEEALLAYHNYLKEAPNMSEEVRKHVIERVADLEMELGEEVTGIAPSVEMSGVDAYLAELENRPQQASSDDVLYKLARAYEQRGNNAKALETLRQLIRRYPDSNYVPEARFRIAEGLFVAQNYQQAATAYGHLLNNRENNAYYYHALYKRGWSLFKLDRYRQALDDFFAVLEHYDSTGDSGSRANRELYADAQRAINMCFVNMNGAASVSDFFARNKHHRYIETVYQSLAEYYLAQERFSDAVQTWSTYVQNYPDSQYAPRYLLKIIDTWRQPGFEQKRVAAQERLINEYGLDTPFWSSHKPEQFSDVRTALKKNTRLLAEHFHIKARESGNKRDYLQAANWYRDYLKNYPHEKDAAELNYLYAEILQEAGHDREALAEYETVVKKYPQFGKRADAGYAAVLLTFQQAESGPVAEREQWRRQSYGTALNFAKLFPADGRVPDVLLHLAEESYRRGEYVQAITLARRVAGQGDVRQKQKALLIAGHSEFETGEYPSVEQTYRTLLQTGRVAKNDRREINKRMALSIYRQGEAARKAGNLPAAVEHFLRVRKEVPASSIVATAEYDAAAGLISMENWPAAIEVLERFREEQPGHRLQHEVTRKLALAYLSSNQPAKAAQEFERLAVVEADAEKRGAALWKAAELYGNNNHLNQAAKLYRQYVREYPAPFDVAMEARQKLVTIYSETGDSRQRDYWRKQIIQADRSAPVSNERSRYLAMTAALEIADAKYRDYQAVQLTIPLKKSLRKKKKLLKEAIDAYAVVAGYGDAATITRAGYRIGEIYYDFSKALMKSERPRGLNAEELEQYGILLEEQAFPFEEKALEFYRSNRIRITDGLYDEWIQKSLERLAEIFPARYSRPEKQDAYIEALQ